MRKYQRTGVALLLLAAVAIAAIGCGDRTTQVESNDDDAADGITVTGEGKATAAPDMAIVSLGVTSRASTVAAARDQAATALEAILPSTKGNGVADQDLQTQNFSIQPEYNYNDGSPTLIGYTVTNTVSVKIRAIDDTSKIVDDAVTAGGNDTRIDSISFTIDDPKQLQEQARQQAVEDARNKAETLASAGGVDLGEALSISEGVTFQPPIYYNESFRGAPAAADVATPIETGQLDVIINVTVRWAIQ